MTIGRDSRFSGVDAVVPVDSAGDALENIRLDLPYPRPLVATAARPDVTQYTVQGSDSWDGLARRFFHGRSDLWWAIAEFSGIVDPYTELGPAATTPNSGGTLTIPSFDTVMFELLGT